jgi:phage host-nuclease inhibitor protein Gam
MSKDYELLAAKTRRQVDNAVSWLEKRYFTGEVRAKKQLNKSAAHLAEPNKSDKNSSR